MSNPICGLFVGSPFWCYYGLVAHNIGLCYHFLIFWVRHDSEVLDQCWDISGSWWIFGSSFSGSLFTCVEPKHEEPK